MQLMRAAVELAAERGVESCTVEDIAAAVDVSPRTFFRYFPTKLDAFFGDKELRLAQIRQALDERASGETVLDAVRRAVVGWVGEFAEDPEFWMTRARIALTHPALVGNAAAMFADVEREVARAVAADLGVDEQEDLRPRLSAALISAAVRSASLTWVARDGRGDPREIANASFDAIERGLGAILHGTHE